MYCRLNFKKSFKFLSVILCSKDYEIKIYIYAEINETIR